ncbi:MAG: FAD-dependent oxidoreductase [Candidatus Kariarchaeaceae archaeon]|jgi:thioredoxin reductase (NADPH)
MVTIKTFYGTPWCSDCKRTKQFLGEQRIAYDHAWVNIDADEDAAMIVEGINDGKRKVPTIIFDDDTILVEPSNAELAEKLGLVTDLGHDFHDLVIIGGGPAGLTCALYAARDGLDVVVVEKSSLGGQASFTERLDNYPGFPEGIAGGELADRIVQQCERFGVEFLKATDVKELISDRGYCVAKFTNGKEISSRAMLLSTGSKYRRLGAPGEDDLIGYKLHFCSTCDGPFYRDMDVAVIGGGNSAFEESIFLTRFVNKVTIYGRSTFKASKVLKDQVEENDKIVLKQPYSVKEILVGEKKTLKGILMVNSETGEEEVVHHDGVFLFIGLDPNTSMVEGKVEVDDGGFVVTDERMMTRIKGLFAAGDVRSGATNQAVSAMGEGAAAAIHIREFVQKM